MCFLERFRGKWYSLQDKTYCLFFPLLVVPSFKVSMRFFPTRRRGPQRASRQQTEDQLREREVMPRPRCSAGQDVDSI